MKQLALFTFKPKPPALPDVSGGTYVHLESIDPNENRYRFYAFVWQQTLWGEWTIRTTWGRIGTMGRSQVTYFESEEALREALPRLLGRRLARGYQPRSVREAGGRYKAAPATVRVHRLVRERPAVDTELWTPIWAPLSA